MLPIIATILAVGTTVVKALAVAGLAIEGLKSVGKVVMSLAKALGLFPEKVTTEELGDKALQAEKAGIKPENYDSYESYVKTVQDFKLDPEKSKLIPEKDKIEKGVEVASNLMTEKFGEGVGELIKATAIDNREFFDEKVIGEVGKLITSDKSIIGKISDFLTGKEKDENILQSTIDTLVTAYKTANPTVSDDTALAKVLSL